MDRCFSDSDNMVSSQATSSDSDSVFIIKLVQGSIQDDMQNGPNILQGIQKSIVIGLMRK